MEIADPPDPATYPALLAEGLRMARQRRASSGFELYVSIERQLEYLLGLVERGEPLSAEKRASLTLGVYAAREFETSDPAFADVLFAVNYLATRLDAAG